MAMSQLSVELSVQQTWSVDTEVYIMKATEFRTWMEAFDRMSRGQRDKLREQLQGKAGGDKGVELIEQSFSAQPVCPHCASTELHRWGGSCGLQRYRCCSCNRTFNALTRTPLAGLRHKDKWLNYEQAMVQGLSIRKAATSCGIAKTPALSGGIVFCAHL